MAEARIYLFIYLSIIEIAGKFNVQNAAIQNQEAVFGAFSLKSK
jgi:hypothetical protein